MGMSKFKKWINRTTFCILAVGVFTVYMTFFSDYNYVKIVEYDNEIKELKAQIAATQDSFSIYQAKLKALESGTESLEKIVREEYHMKRDNEDVYIVKEK